MDTFINIVGMYYHQNDITVDINVGDFVMLRPDPRNAYDRDAIIVYNTTNEQLGFVSNSNKTIADGCRKASEIKHLMNRIVTGTVCFIKDNVIIVRLDV